MQFELATAEEIAQELGRRLRAQRLALDLQQGELAARAGLSARAVRNLERTGQASLESLIRIVMALGLAGSFADLLAYKPDSLKSMEAASTARQRASRQQK